MREPTWAKNLLFLSLVIGGVSLLTIYLMATERIETPTSFAPKSKKQQDVLAVATQIDSAFHETWISKGLEHSERAPNLAVARRLSLGLAGTIPSVEEIRKFEQQPEENQIHWWVSRLLEDDRTSNHLAERFARAFVGVEDGPFLVFRRRRFVSWLSDEIKANRRYDKLARQILTGEGLWTDTPSVNFYTRALTNEEEEQKPDPILLAGRTSRAFLGMRIDCLQCHDDFLGTINLGSEDAPEGGMQTDFHSLAAFFAKIENSLLGIRDRPGKGPYEYQLLDEDEETVIAPKVPFNEQFDGEETNLRRRLANWTTHPENKPFARATVNRVWAIMTGRGLIQPVDDIPLEGPFPPAMEILVDDFIANDFNLHRLIRIIASTETLHLDSAADFEITTKHEKAWAVFPMIRLRPDQVAGAVIQSTKLSTIDSMAHIITQLTKFGQQSEFVTRFGDAGEDEFKDRGETVTQRLLMLNGKMIDERLENPLYSPMHLSNLAPNAEATVETVFLSTLTRRPTKAEKETFVPAIESQYGNSRLKEVLDVYWTMINSAEFRWNH
ncbi:MAG: DUF1549 domain-containing protein [Mariniblastus sp.]